MINMPYNIKISPLTMVDSDTTNLCLDREPIADQPRCRVLQSQMLRYTCPFIFLRFAFTIGSHIVHYPVCRRQKGRDPTHNPRSPRKGTSASASQWHTWSYHVILAPTPRSNQRRSLQPTPRSGASDVLKFKLSFCVTSVPSERG